MAWSKARFRRLNRVTHRDLGYFATSLTIAYALSGIALNHHDDWNPDFRIDRAQVEVPAALRGGGELDPARVAALGALVGEEEYKVFDTPAPDQVKIYYDNATLHVRLAEGTAVYERVSRRPLFYEVNVLHRNSFKPWKWGADLFAVVLILLNLTGLILLKGKHGIGGRGKWFILAGAVPPVVVLLLHG